MAGRGGAGQKGFWAKGGKGGFTATKVHGKEDFGLRAEKGLIAKKILDLDLNPKSFLAAGGRQRGGTARKILGLDLSSKSFLAVEGEQREGSRQKRLCVRGAPPPGHLTMASSWQKRSWI